MASHRRHHRDADGREFGDDLYGDGDRRQRRHGDRDFSLTVNGAVAAPGHRLHDLTQNQPRWRLHAGDRLRRHRLAQL